MPTYEYECTKCHNKFEVLQSMKDEPLKQCPKCNGPVRRLIGKGAGIIFKGSGFYATDYRSSNYTKRQQEENSSGTCSKKSDSDQCSGCKSSSAKKIKK